MKLTNEQYHADREHVSKTWLDKINKSPAHLYEYLNEEPKEKTEALIFGGLLHEMVLEQHHENYVLPPKINRRTKDGKVEWTDFVASIGNKQIITQEMLDKAEKMRLSIFQNKFAKSLLRKGDPEQTVFYKDESGVLCKARADWVSENGTVDLKTTLDASHEGFKRALRKYRYNVQAAHYEQGFNVGEFIFIAIEKEPPYCCAVYRTSASSFYEGKEERKRNLETYIECKEKNEWPGYPEIIQEV
ncbi:MAG: PD-(D/E)XK nuclease-like domain-containing protein [Pseudomonadota bacterium]